MATIIRNEKLFCTKCGGDFALTYPLPIDDLIEKMAAFNDLHKDCKQTWVEPTADQDKSVKEKAMWWNESGERGMSSKTMWNCFMGNKNFKINHPHDPSDFGRCWKLLEAIPEWKNELNRLKPLSTAWSNLVDNWNELTKMYEQNRKEDWVNHEKIGMFELMKKLT